MKAASFALSIACAISLPSSALAGSSSKTFPVSVTIVPGNTCTAYLVGNDVVTTVRDVEEPAPPVPAGAIPLVQVGFDRIASQIFVKHVTLNKQHHRLTIDF